jgi:hypothetical protein
MPEMVSAYIRMCAEAEMPARPRSESRVTVEEVYEIQVVDMFGKFATATNISTSYY